MRVKFLVVFAVLCLFAHHASANNMGGGKEEKGPKTAAAPPVPKPAPAPAAPVAPAKPESEEYDIEVIKHKKEHTEKKEKEKKTHIEIKKEVKKKEHKVISCAERTKKNKEDCETKDVPKGHKGVFTYKDDEKEECSWECNYEPLPPPPGEKKEDKHEKKVVKVIKPPKEKKEKKEKKECSGEKVIKFQNCLVKIRGLIAFGDKTKNFDKKFEKLVQAKKNKGAKKAKGGKKAPGKKPAAAPAGPPPSPQGRVR